MNFRFDPIEHRYFLENRELLGLTAILKAAGFYNFEFVNDHDLEFARRRGTAVHLATAFSDRGTLNEGSIHPEIAPYLTAWRRFRGEVKTEMLHVENPIYSKRWRFACTPDRIVIVNGKLSVLEIKASEYLSAAYQLQTQGQQIAAEDFYKEKVKSRFTVRLFDNGTYRLEEYKEAADKARFMACLTIAQFKKERSLK